MNAFKDREATNAVLTELLSEFTALRTEMTDRIARIQGSLLNDVLDVYQHTFGTVAVLNRSYRAPVGCIVVDNQSSSNAVTVTSYPNADEAPTSGTGLATIPAGTVRTIPIGSRTISVAGTEGDVVCIQVYAAAARPTSGSA